MRHRPPDHSIHDPKRRRVSKREQIRASLRLLVRATWQPLWRLTHNFARAWQALVLGTMLASNVATPAAAQTADQISAVVEDGTLTVTGTPNADTITVATIGGFVKVNGQDPGDPLNGDMFTRLVLNAGAGDDSIDVSNALGNFNGFAMEIDAGAGRDTVAYSRRYPGLVQGGADSGDILRITSDGEIVLGEQSIDINRISSTYNGFEIVDLIGINGPSPVVFDARNATANVRFSSFDGGDNTFIGGAGDDVFTVSNGFTAISDLSASIDQVVLSADSDITLNGIVLLWGDNRVTFNGAPEVAFITGGAGANTLDASRFMGEVSLDGQGGDDTLIGSVGNSSFTPGSGVNTVLTSPNNGFDQLFFTGAGEITLTDTLFSTAGTSTTLNGFFDFATITGSSSDDLIDASAWSSDLRIDAGKSDDTVRGGTGTNTLQGGADSDTIEQTASEDQTLTDTSLSGRGSTTISEFERAKLTSIGNTTIDASAFTGAAHLIGGNGNETLIGGPGDNIFEPGGGTNTVGDQYSADRDQLRASGDGDFTLTSSKLTGPGGITTLNGSIETALLTGGAGNNTIDAAGFGSATQARGIRATGAGGVTINGGAGSDTITGSGGNDTLDGGDGFDILRQQAAGVQTITDTQATGRGTDSLARFERAELTGSAGNDTITATGFSGALVARGLAGNDSITGGSG
ncbi:MAG: hypothetical protein H7Z42_05915, partial [Roseiflexaceae bacterium]|nr:hypothetical protein [Roseiflexaceae bacterium]